MRRGRKSSLSRDGVGGGWGSLSRSLGGRVGGYCSSRLGSGIGRGVGSMILWGGERKVRVGNRDCRVVVGNVVVVDDEERYYCCYKNFDECFDLFLLLQKLKKGHAFRKKGDLQLHHFDSLNIEELGVGVEGGKDQSRRNLKLGWWREREEEKGLGVRLIE